jgi:hypothetical protein
MFPGCFLSYCRHFLSSFSNAFFNSDIPLSFKKKSRSAEGSKASGRIVALLISFNSSEFRFSFKQTLFRVVKLKSRFPFKKSVSAPDEISKSMASFLFEYIGFLACISESFFKMIFRSTVFVFNVLPLVCCYDAKSERNFWEKITPEAEDRSSFSVLGDLLRSSERIT